MDSQPANFISPDTMFAVDTYWLIWIVAAYGCGSIPFGLIIGLLRGVDIRKAGSGNIGATNAGRVLGRRWGIVCFVLDVIKGFAPVFASGFARGLVGQTSIASTEAWCWLAVAAAAILGHVFPVWLRFKGGKGVATSFGVLLGVWPALAYPVLIALAIWIVVVKMSRYVSLASMGAAVSLPVSVIAIGASRGAAMSDLSPFIVVTILMALLVIVRHRANITRLMAGTESRIGGSKQSET